MLQIDRNCPTLHPRRFRHIMDREQPRHGPPLRPPFVPRSCIPANPLFHLTSPPLLPTGTGTALCLLGRTLLPAFNFMPIYAVGRQAKRKKRQTQSRIVTPLVCRVYHVIWLSLLHSHLRNVSVDFRKDWYETGCEDVGFNSRRI